MVLLGIVSQSANQELAVDLRPHDFEVAGCHHYNFILIGSISFTLHRERFHFCSFLAMRSFPRDLARHAAVLRTDVSPCEELPAEHGPPDLLTTASTNCCY